MTRPLAIFTRQIGVPSETFIRRHIDDLLPGGTVAVAHGRMAHDAATWDVECPLLVLSTVSKGVGNGWMRRLARSAARVSGRGGSEKALALAKFLRVHRVHVVLGEFLHTGLPWLPLFRRLGIRFVAHAHGYDAACLMRDPAWREAYRQLSQADGVVTVNRIQRKRLIELGVPAERIWVVPYGTDVPATVSRRPERPVLRCLAVGRMVDKKAPILLLDAVRRACEVLPQLRLDYVGDGQLLSAARQFVRAFHLEDRVVFHGAQPHAVVKRFMQEADIFLQHSITDPDSGNEEGLPVAILEAMAYSLPVVSTRHAGIPDAVVEGLTGYLVEEGDTAGMADRLLALARNPELCWRMGLAGWQRAQGEFSWTHARARLLEILGLNGHATS